MEEEGMTDMQYRDHLRAVIADLEDIKAKGVSDAAAEKIDQIIARYKKSL